MPTVTLVSMDEFASFQNKSTNNEDDSDEFDSDNNTTNTNTNIGDMILPLKDHHCLPLEVASTMAVAELVTDNRINNRLQHTQRAEYLSVSFYKKSPEQSLGFKLHRSAPQIASIYKGGLADTSPLAVGDKILSINNRDCSQMDSVQLCKFLWQLVGTVTIVVHNEKGAPNLVTCMITKTCPEQMVGIGMKGGPDHLRLSSIDAEKLSAETILNVGDQILSINGQDTEHMEGAAEAANLIKLSPKCVTITAKTLSDTGIVICQVASPKDNAKSSSAAATASRLLRENTPIMSLASTTPTSLDPRSWQLRSGMNLFGAVQTTMAQMATSAQRSRSNSQDSTGSNNSSSGSGRRRFMSVSSGSGSRSPRSNNNTPCNLRNQRAALAAWEMEVEI